MAIEQSIGDLAAWSNSRGEDHAFNSQSNIADGARQCSRVVGFVLAMHLIGRGSDGGCRKERLRAATWDPGAAGDNKKSAAVVDVEEARRDGDGGPAGGGDAVSVYSESSLVQAGVQKAMILKKAWSRTTLLIAFTSLFLTTLVITFSDYSHSVLQPYVTSAFKKHSFMSAAHVVINITRIVAYPIIAKLSDVFGRAEMFTLSIVFQTLSFIVYATSADIGAYFAAGLFDAVGSTGFGLTQQVFIADATNLINRAFWSTLPESITTIPALYLGSLIGEGFLTKTGWRWSYGAWAIVVPVVAIP
ncbi:hypothetical protein ACCO45_002582 [Purpureocillium lilacinum]|uniref:Uncharacterized protein n=1 Tax=Purpureocillium lilacinum TaxID=33203 RepID=A0ACC4EB42_PURLI